MDSFLQRAKSKLSKLIEPNSSKPSTPQQPVNSTPTSGLEVADAERSPAREFSDSVPSSGSQPDSKSKRLKGKDRTIHVHPVLDHEFEDNITPPRSPTNRGSVKSKESPAPSNHSKDPPLLSPTSDRNLKRKPSASEIKASVDPSLQAALLHAAQVRAVLQAETVDLTTLRRLCWSGCPHELRLECWSLLTGYHQPLRSTRDDLVRRKRSEYHSYIRRLYDVVNWDNVLGSANGFNTSSSLSSSTNSASVGSEELAIMKQIRKDVPRTSGGVAFLQHARTMHSLERVLYIWALRHPACGYVQGMNDLLLPFVYAVFASRFAPNKLCSELVAFTEKEVEEAFQESKCSEQEWLHLEGDLYWLSSAMLSGIQENFTYNQAGAHNMVAKLDKLISNVDPQLCRHLEQHGITFTQFAFRWMNCLLIREFAMMQVLRLWDSYLSDEGGDLVKLHVYVCAALLIRWSPQLTAEKDFSKVMTFLQSPPTNLFKDRDMDEIISKAYLMQELYSNAGGHLRLTK